MSLQKPTVPAKQVASLSALHNLQAAGSEESKLDVSSSTVKTAGGGATGTSDRNLHVDKNQQQSFADFSDAVSARVSGVEKSVAGLNAKFDSVMALLQQSLAGQQQLGAGMAAAKPAAVETKSASFHLAAAQEARLAAVWESAFGTNASIQG